MAPTVKRPYRSRLRESQARATRLAVIQAASRLFVERGYVATSIDAIAEAAGVSRATVFAAGGTKAALVKTAYDIALVGDDEPVSLPERPRSRMIRSQRDPRRYLAMYAELAGEVGARIAPIFEAVRGAASADSEIREVFAKIQAERRIGAAHVVDDILARSPLRAGLDPVEAADVVWVLSDPGLQHLLVVQRGWQPARYAAWLGETMETQLLGPASTPSDPAGTRSSRRPPGIGDSSSGPVSR